MRRTICVGSADLLAERYALPFRQTFDKSQSLQIDEFLINHRIKGVVYIFTGNGLDDLIWWCAQQLRNDRELVHIYMKYEVLYGE